MFHRHPLLSLVTFAYLGFVGWMTLTPQVATPDWTGLAARVLLRMQRHPELDPLTSRLTVDRAEFLANIALFVPVGVFLLLLFGCRLWWLAAGAGFAMTAAIETAQRSIPGRISDPRDVVANTAGALLGVALALILTFPGTMRRRRRRRDQRQLVGSAGR